MIWHIREIHAYFVNKTRTKKTIAFKWNFFFFHSGGGMDWTILKYTIVFIKQLIRPRTLTMVLGSKALAVWRAFLDTGTKWIDLLQVERFRRFFSFIVVLRRLGIRICHHNQGQIPHHRLSEKHVRVLLNNRTYTNSWRRLFTLTIELQELRYDGPFI